MRTFGTRGIVRPDQHYVVARTDEVKNFINRIKEGRYIVLFAPRQTGKTTFFRLALAKLTAEDPTYFPIQLDFQVQRNTSATDFYSRLYQMMLWQIQSVFQRRDEVPSEALARFLERTQLTDAFSMVAFFEKFGKLLGDQRVLLLIDEFDGIPQALVSDFLYALRHIYLSDVLLCPHSVGIVGVKSIAQLDYDRSISPFNIQDELYLPNFTFEQVRELFKQYTTEVGQAFAPEVVKSIHKQTAGQPFLVNRAAQILTEELAIPKTEPITMTHFTKAYEQLLGEDNTNLTHLLTNIRKDRRFETLLMDIMSYEEGVRFNPRDELISELITYGVIRKGTDGKCEIVNPIYLHCIIEAFTPTVNGLERNYFAEDNSQGFRNYLTPTGHLDMDPLLDNFQDFITRVGFKILQVPETPQEYVGRHLLLTYLDSFVKTVGGVMTFEVPTGAGKMDLLIIHNQQKYIVETKIWRGDTRYQAGKKQLATYLKMEGVSEGYYVVFDHRRNPEPRMQTETVDGVKIRSYVIPVVQEAPSAAKENT